MSNKRYDLNNFKQLKGLLIVGIALLVFSLSVLFPKPLNATTGRYQIPLDRGLIDRVKTPSEVGLDYLQQEPVQLADNSLLNSIYQAEEAVAVLPEDIPLRFDLGTNYPIRIRQLQDGAELTTKTGYDAVGYVDRSENAKSFNSSVLRAMFAVEGRNGGNLAITSEAQHILVADASRKFWQAKRIPTIDLIVHNQENNQVFILRNANANAICRDALNSVLNQTLHPNKM